MRPAHLEILESSQFWGRWNAQTRTISLSRRLLLEHDWFHVVAVLRHEMAHQWVEEILGESGRPHGAGFKEGCRRLGVPQFMETAAVHLHQQTLDWREQPRDEVSEKMLDRVRKLLSLATSSNEHEALSAMNRVRDIYARHNLEAVATESEFVHLILNTGFKRLPVMEQKIIGILVGHFFVQVIVGRNFNVHDGGYYRFIEIIGTRSNVMMAEYVYYFLRQQVKDLTSEKQTQSRLSPAAGRAYRLGLLQGFDDKLAGTTEDPLTVDLQQALTVFHKNPGMDNYIRRVHPRLLNLKSQARLRDPSAYREGQKRGQKITLHKAMTDSAVSVVRHFLNGKNK